MELGLDLEPTLLSPSVLGDQVERVLDGQVRPYMDASLPTEDRVALLCAALERPSGRTSPIHVTGISLLGHAQSPVDLPGAWRRIGSTPEGVRLLRVTKRLGQGQDVSRRDIQAVHEHLGSRRHAWESVVQFALWAETTRRMHANRLRPCLHENLDAWLSRVVQAQQAFPKA